MRTFFTACLTAFLLVITSADIAAQSNDVESRPTVTITDDDIKAGEMKRWTSDNVYILDGLVIVEDGAELRIVAGTVVKAKDGTGSDAAAIVIARVGKILAEGSSN